MSTDAPHLKCISCGHHEFRLFHGRLWAVCRNCGKGQTFGDAQSCECWGIECPGLTEPAAAPEPTAYDPAPGTEHSYALSDYAHAAAHALGDKWTAESGYLGAWGVLTTTHADGDPLNLRLYVDDAGDLCVDEHEYDALATEESGVIPDEQLPDSPPHTPAELAAWGAAIAAAINEKHQP
jgi:hypothetical protein